MTLRWHFLLPLLLLILPVACGGEEDPLWAPIEYTPEIPTPVVVEEAVQDISLDGFLMAETNYLFYYRSLADSLVSLNRSLVSQGEIQRGSQQDYDLAWVVDVHDLITRSEGVYSLILSLEADDAIRDKYATLYLDTLRTIDLMVVGGDRLLAAAILLGPTGRSYEDMSDSEKWQFDALVSESGHWLSSSETLASSLSSAVSDHILRLDSP